MMNLCTDPTCDEEAGLTLQRQLDPAPVPYCHPHGAQRQHELKQALENFRVVVFPPTAPPSELELAQRQLARYEAQLGPEVPELAAQLDQALATLDGQGKSLEQARVALAERGDVVKALRAEVEKTRLELQRAVTRYAELEQVRAAELEQAHAEIRRVEAELLLERATAPRVDEPVPPGPITPPPPTRPDPK